MDEQKVEEVVLKEPIKLDKKNKILEAKSLIESSQKLVTKVEADVAKCKVGLSKAAEEFDSAKRTFKNVTFKNVESLLERTGFEYVSYEESEAFELSIDDGNQENFSVKKLRSGRFTGLILALLAAFATVGVWIYLAISKLNIDTSNINIETATSHVNPILTWIGEHLLSGESSLLVGSLILGFSALIMAWIVYAVRVAMRGSKNLHLAKDTLDKATQYSMTQDECKDEMKKIDMHLREASVEISNFETILNEKAAVLKRIIHVEGSCDEEKEYHPSSKKVMRETEKIMRAAENLLETAITEEKKLNFKSVQALKSARDVYAEYLSRIYD